MNKAIIRYMLGTVMRIESLLMLIPALVGLIYREKEGVAYLLVAIICLVIGFLASKYKPENSVFYLKEGCVITAMSWIVMSIWAALPFVINQAIPDYVDALFETISGFTTTGASILSDVEALSHADLFWRSFTHWVGGMGVLVFLLAIMPAGGGSNMNLMKAESPGPSVGKLVPKVRHTARILYGIYLGMTLIQIILMILGRMPVFDAVTLGMGTAGTGGFGVRGDSVASYSLYLQWVITIFMLLFSINFNAYYFMFFDKISKVFKIEEIRYFIGIVAAAIAVIFFQILGSYTAAGEGAFKAFTDASFQVASIISTTGFSTADFNVWSPLAKTTLVLIMFIGACAGSTGGGMKVSRILLLFKTVGRELKTYLHPKMVRQIKMDGKTVEDSVLQAAYAYLVAYVAVFVVSLIIITIDEKDLVTNFTAVTATLNNIGPGLNEVGPMGNFAGFSVLSKIVLMFDMIAGRLELFPMLVLFNPATWGRN